MLNREFKYLPVVDYDNKLLGIVNRTTMVDVVYDTIWGNSDDNIAEKEDQAKYQETATVKESDYYDDFLSAHGSELVAKPGNSCIFLLLH